ncbi:hypothetical protein MMC29_004380 [Sticta canariensis]|nr:hypothetical protein [Sticta canariensis]
MRSSTIYLLYAIFGFQSSYLISAQPSILGKLSSRSTIEGQDTAQYRGIATVPFIRSPALRTLGRDVRKVKGEPGAKCFGKGSHMHRDQINPLIDTACTDLTSRKLTWEKVDDDLKDKYKNPMVTYNASLDGDPLWNIEKMSSNLTFYFYDQNNGAKDSDMTKDSCTQAYTNVLNTCCREKGTMGGVWYSEDILVAYAVS